MPRWIGPYRSVGERSLPRNEVFALKRRCRRLLVLARTFGIASLIGFLALASEYYAIYVIEEVGITYRVAMICTLMGIFPLISISMFRRAQRYRLDAVSGVYERFEMCVDLHEIRRVFGSDIDVESEGNASYIDIYPSSGIIRSISGLPYRGTRSVQVSVSYDTNEDNRELFPSRLLWEDLIEGQPTVARTMTREEVSELGYHRMERIRSLYPMFAAILVVGLLLSTYLWIRQDLFPPAVAPVFLGCVLLGLMLYCYCFWRSLDQFVVDANVKLVASLSKPSHSVDQSSLDVEHVEVLIHSNKVWTVNGRPADWRRSIR